MNKYESAIIRYESARVNQRNVKRAHSDLISKCDRVQYIEGNMHPLHSTTCGQNAWSKYAKFNQDLPYDEQDTFEDVFYNAINNSDGACDHCKEAFDLKHGLLAKVNKEYGIAKRAISMLGKGLITQG